MPDLLRLCAGVQGHAIVDQELPSGVLNEWRRHQVAFGQLQFPCAHPAGQEMQDMPQEDPGSNVSGAQRLQHSPSYCIIPANLICSNSRKPHQEYMLAGLHSAWETIIQDLAFGKRFRSNFSNFSYSSALLISTTLSALKLKMTTASPSSMVPTGLPSSSVITNGGSCWSERALPPFSFGACWLQQQKFTCTRGLLIECSPSQDAWAQ